MIEPEDSQKYLQEGLCKTRGPALVRNLWSCLRLRRPNDGLSSPFPSCHEALRLCVCVCTFTCAHVCDGHTCMGASALRPCWHRRQCVVSWRLNLGFEEPSCGSFRGLLMGSSSSRCPNSEWLSHTTRLDRPVARLHVHQCSWVRPDAGPCVAVDGTRHGHMAVGAWVAASLYTEYRFLKNVYLADVSF